MGKHKCPHTDQPIFSKGRCHQCARASYKPLRPSTKQIAVRIPLKRSNKPIPKTSKKRQAQLDQYYIDREDFLKKNCECKAKLKRCLGVADQVHHMEGRENDLLLDQSKWLPICAPCHEIITVQSAMAIEEGLSISRHAKNNDKS